jgi:hypothetical protein
MSFRVEWHCGAGPIEWRYAYRNAGTGTTMAAVAPPADDRRKART